MKFNFVPMNETFAKEMIENWKYDNEYSIYDYSFEAKWLLEETRWGNEKFAVLNEDDNLIGEFTIEFFQETFEFSDNNNYVDIQTVKNNPDNSYQMWVGWGLKPNLTGKGLGKSFVSACIDFAVKLYNYRGEYIRLGVAEFNNRAIKVYSKLGFHLFTTSDSELAGKKLKILCMKKRLA